jgi:hypothetical protein
MSDKAPLYRPPTELDLFVLRRAVRYGIATRADVREAFGRIGTTKATQALDYSALHWPRTLERTGKAVRLRDDAEIPPEAGEAQLMDCLDNGWLEFRHTGLRPRELPVERVRWTTPQPERPGVLSTVVAAVAHEEILRIRYVGLRENESARWRRVYPVGLERLGEQWRVIAQDLEAEGYPLKTFVLSRILDSEPTAERRPRDMVRLAADDRLVSYPVRLNPKLTEDQRRVLTHELQIENGRVVLPKRGEFEYFRRFADAPVNEDVVWPPLSRDEE